MTDQMTERLLPVLDRTAQFPACRPKLTFDELLAYASTRVRKVEPETTNQIFVPPLDPRSSSNWWELGILACNVAGCGLVLWLGWVILTGQ